MLPKNILAINVNHWMINEDALYVSTPISSLPFVLHLLIRLRHLTTWGGQRKMFILSCPRGIFKWFAGSKTIYPLYVRHLLIASFAFHNLLLYLWKKSMAIYVNTANRNKMFNMHNITPFNTKQKLCFYISSKCHKLKDC